MKPLPTYEELMTLAKDCRPIERMISTTIPGMDGWCSTEKAYTLAGLVLHLKPKLCLEIGTYAGRSFLPILWALEQTQSGKAIGIDPYSAQVSSDQEFPGNAEWWAALDHGLIERKFHAFLKSFGLEKYAHIIKKKSDDVTFPDNIDIAHIDGGHHEGGYNDIVRIGPKMRVGGVVVLDDIRWVGGSILRGITFLEETGFKEVFCVEDQNWNVMVRVK